MKIIQENQTALFYLIKTDFFRWFLIEFLYNIHYISKLTQ